MEHFIYDLKQYCSSDKKPNRETFQQLRCILMGLMSFEDNLIYNLQTMNNKTVKFLNGDRELYERFKLKQVIGTGNSIVYQVIDDENNIQCVKEIRLDDKQTQFIFRKQIELLSKIKHNPHPNIVEYKGSYTIQEQRGHINHCKKGYIQMEKGIANLKTYLSSRKEPFDQEDVIMFITCMIEVFAHLQKSEVAHRDIKPSNILLFSEDPLYFKVCDVGAGTAVGFCDHTKQMTVIGTPYYLSPQLFKAYREKMHLVNYKAFKSDTYSLGLLFLEFCSLKKIQDRMNKESEKIEAKIQEIKAIYPNIIGLGKVLRKMLEQQVTNRMDFIELQKFISENNLLRNRIDKTVELDPNLLNKISSSSLIVIDKIEDLSQMQNLVSTENKFQKLNITIQTGIGSSKSSQKDILEDLINIKYMKLQELRLSIQMGKVTDKHLFLISEALQKNKNMKTLSLNLWNNQITSAGFKTLLKTIKSHLLELRLLELNISSNQVRIDHTFEEFFDFSSLLELKNLDLNLGYNEINPEFLIVMFKNIAAAQNISVLSINLQSTPINPSHFGRAARELYSLQKVEDLSLNISSNSMREEGIYAVADICVNMSSLTSLKLYLRNSEISDKGCIQFMKTISKIEKLRQLKINLMNNQITEKTMKNGAPYLENLTKIETLDMNLSNNKLSDFAFKYLCNSVLVLKSITKLRLVFDTCSLTEKGCHYLGRLISQEPNIQELDLSIRYNDVNFDGVQCICAGLIKIKKVKKLKLNFEGTKIGDYSANYLASCLLKLRSLSSVDLNLEGCDLTSETMSNIVKAVRQCCQKTEEITIDMRRNKEIKQELIEQLRISMENRKVAIKVDNTVDPPQSSFITA